MILIEDKVVAVTVDDASYVDVAAKKLHNLKSWGFTNIFKQHLTFKPQPQFQGGDSKLESLIQYLTKW